MKLVPQVVHMPWATPLVLSIVINYYLSRLFEFSDKGGRQLQLVVFFEFSDKGGRQQQVVDVCIAVVTVVAKGGHVGAARRGGATERRGGTGGWIHGGTQQFLS